MEVQIDQAPGDYAAADGRRPGADSPGCARRSSTNGSRSRGDRRRSCEAILEHRPRGRAVHLDLDPAEWPALLAAHRLHTTILDRMPGARRRYTYLMPLMDAAFRTFDLSAFDLVVSSNHASAKNVRVRRGHPTRLLLPHSDALRLGREFSRQ